VILILSSRFIFWKRWRMFVTWTANWFGFNETFEMSHRISIRLNVKYDKFKVFLQFLLTYFIIWRIYYLLLFQTFFISFTTSSTYIFIKCHLYILSISAHRKLVTVCYWMFFSVANRFSSLKALLNQHTTSANNIIRIGYSIFIPSPVKGTKK